MLTSLALIFLVGLSLAAICQKIKLPRIIGMLLTGILLGPYVLDMLDSSILAVSAELRQLALVIILIKAGLSLDIHDLKQVGRSALLLSFLPAVFEIAAFVLFAPAVLPINRLDAAMMGAVLGAVGQLSNQVQHFLEINSRGDKKPSVFRGRLLIRDTTACNSSSVTL